MDLEKFFERINYTGSCSPSLETLNEICKAFALSVPYSNASLTSGRILECSLDTIYDVIVNKKQGGICVENNGLMSHFLKQLGFKVRKGQGSFYFRGEFTCEFYHSTPVVVLESGEEWCYDLGWKLFQPVKFVTMLPQVQHRGVYRVRKEKGTKWHLFERLRKTVLDKDGKVIKQGPYKDEWDEKKVLDDTKMMQLEGPSVWHHLYKFETSDHDLKEFTHMFELWSNPEKHSILQDNLFVHKFTEDGMIQIENNVFSRKVQLDPITDQIVVEFKIKNDQHAQEILKEQFGQNLDRDITFFKRHKFV